MLKIIIRTIALSIPVVALTACGSLFDKDNTPTPKALTKNPHEVRPQFLWSTKAGTGTDDEYLKLKPALSDNAIYVVSYRGVVTAVEKTTGKVLWKNNLELSVNSGPGAGDNLVVIGGRKGEVIALNQSTGNIVWRKKIEGEILANPAVANGKIVVKTIDGYVRGLSTNNGNILWTFKQVEPNLILHTASTPLIRDSSTIVGFENGNLAKLSLNGGDLHWLKTLAVPQGAFSIQRMIDIDADPVVYGHRIFAATYQGKITSLDWTSGRTLWSHDISSYTGMTADNTASYISDTKSYVWSFDADTGLVNWRQTDLESRVISGPAMMGNYIVLGDKLGYVHWLSKRDGHIAGRVSVGSAVYASPISENNVIYVLNEHGYLKAYKI